MCQAKTRIVQASTQRCPAKIMTQRCAKACNGASKCCDVSVQMVKDQRKAVEKSHAKKSRQLQPDTHGFSTEQEQKLTSSASPIQCSHRCQTITNKNAKIVGGKTRKSKNKQHMWHFSKTCATYCSMKLSGQRLNTVDHLIPFLLQ